MFQKNYNTYEICVYLNNYNVDTEYYNVVPSKEMFVMKLLTDESDAKILEIASENGIDVLGLTASNPSDEIAELPNVLEKAFISHSSLDKPYVGELIDLLESIGLPSNKIFCSSYEGYSIDLGNNFLDHIKSELDNRVLVLFILSENFMSSPVCLCEMGASWIKTHEHVPILIPPFSYSDIRGVIPMTQGMEINVSSKLSTLKLKVEQSFGLPPIDHRIWERKKDRFLSNIARIVDASE